ncbi:MAG: phosphonopyruvate decarboxylase [Acidobacteriota bacterium]
MEPKVFLEEIEAESFSPYMGVPCSVFTPLLNYLNESGRENYACTSEGEAMGLAGGFALAGKLPVVYMQNDGYGNAVNPLSSLQLLYKLPALLLISWRGFPGKKDAPQHMLMGETIEDLLKVFKIPYTIIEEETDLNSAVKTAKGHCETNRTPYAFIIKKGYFEKSGEAEEEKWEELNIRTDYLEVLKGYLTEKDIILGTTGFTGRELYSYLDHPGKFYMTGSMGCLSSIGLGIAIEEKERRVILLDGDGAVLMKTGTLATIGKYSPENLIHICFDNRVYESTGGQPTVSDGADLSGIAEASGYRSVYDINTPEMFRELLEDPESIKGPSFILIRIKTGTMEGLPRPTDTPEEMRDKLQNFLKGS